MSVNATGAASGFASRLRAINLRPSVDPSFASGDAGESQNSASEDSSKRSSEDEDPSNGFGVSYGPSWEAPADQFENRSSPDHEEKSSPAPATGEAELSEAERRTLDKLKRIDQRVGAHEQAHLAAAGQYAQGGISLEFITGPDGQQYAVGGSVQLDTSEAGTPEETVRKMQQVKQAAIAPADPSPQDQQVAVEASRKLAEVRSKMQENGGREVAESSVDSQFSNDPPSSGTENDRGFEGPEDIGIDVDQRTETYIADRRSSSSNESGSALNASSESSDTSAVPDLLDQFVTGTSDQLSAGRSGQVFTASA